MAHALHKEDTNMRMRQAGVTLLELMIVVAIIAVLATIAFPYFSGSTRRAKSSEVPKVFADIKVRQEQYHFENGIYLATGASDTDYFPAVPAGPDQPQDVTSRPTTWQDLKLQADKNALYCAYVVIAGERGDSTNIGTTAQSFGFNSAPEEDWFYMLAECDFDGNPGVNSLYFMSSTMAKIAKKNEGR